MPISASSPAVAVGPSVAWRVSPRAPARVRVAPIAPRWKRGLVKLMTSAQLSPALK
jgi:hypothetical protein